MSNEKKTESQQEAPAPYIDPKEVMKRLVYKPAALVWENFQQKQPNPDRWVVLWCNLGRIAPNLILTYRDATGNYDLPHPTKAYPAQAWAYIDLPEVNQEALTACQKEIEEASAKNMVEAQKAALIESQKNEAKAKKDK